MAWTPPTDWIAGRGLTAAQLQTDLAGNLSEIGLWSSWTPTWTASTTNPVLGNGTMVGRYTRIGDLVIAMCTMTMGTTTTYGTDDWHWALPVEPTPIQSNFRHIGVGWLYDVGVHTIFVDAHLRWYNSVAQVNLYANGGTLPVKQGTPQTWVSGDALSWRVIYEGV